MEDDYSVAVACLMSPWAKSMIKRFPKTRAEKGFTLIELLLSISLGSMLFVVFLQLIGADLRLGSGMASRLRESAQQRSTLELIHANGSPCCCPGVDQRQLAATTQQAACCQG